MPERLHKLLAQRGLGSRREIEKWMLAGRVRLNGRPAAPGDRYNEGDRVVVDGKDVTARLRLSAPPQILMYHKPQGQPVATRSTREGEEVAEQSVMERLPAVRGARWLAINTMQPVDSGLLLLTTDGAFADALRRHSESIPAAYVARVLAPPDLDVESIPRIVQYDDHAVEFHSIEPAGGEGINRWFRVESQRAHRRAAVRALFESCGLKVSRVIQVQFAGIELPRDLPRGRHRALSDRQVDALYQFAQLERPAQTPPERNARGRAGRATRARIPPDRRVAGNRKSGR